MDLLDFDFVLPKSLIGQTAIEPRDSCRLLMYQRNSKQISHHVFGDLTRILDDNTVLVLNDTKVFPARLFGVKNTGGKTEILLLKQLSQNCYSAIGKGKNKVGTKIVFSPDLSGEITKNNEGEVEITFNQSGFALIEKIDQLGKTPLPPYIQSVVKEKDLRIQYQTIYAKEKGSAAAPTAGLHFTDKLLEKLKDKGVQIEKVTLHVGLGTFKPVTEEQVISKTLHTECFIVSDETANNLNEAKKLGKKIIAVGTTSCRLLETLSNQEGIITSGQGETNIFIQPGYRFKFVDGLITNFHLPSTSLLMLVSALTLSPNTSEELKKFSDSPIGMIYQEAIKEKYKFFSFGDAMLVL